MAKFIYSNEIIEEVNNILQLHMKENYLSQMTPDECADLLALKGILSNKIGPKPGFNFRQMLRDGRDGKIPKIKGIYQETPRKRWIIHKV